MRCRGVFVGLLLAVLAGPEWLGVSMRAANDQQAQPQRTQPPSTDGKLNIIASKENFRSEQPERVRGGGFGFCESRGEAAVDVRQRFVERAAAQCLLSRVERRRRLGR